MKKILALMSVVAASSAAMAQTTGGLDLAGLGIGGLVLLGILVFVLFRFLGGNDD